MYFQFNIKELESLLKHFFTLTHMRIVVFDDLFMEIASYPNHHSTYCRILRKDELANKKCSICDRESCTLSKKHKKMITYRCHAGLTEVVTPIQYDNIVVGYIMLGQILQTDNYSYSWNEIEPYLQQYDVNITNLKNAYYKKKRLSDETLIAASKIMEACSGYLVLSKMIIINEDTLAKKLDEFINKNLNYDLSVDNLCKQFTITKTRLYSLSEHSYGIGIAEHIRTLRIEKAKLLLINTDEKVSEVAYLCGFTDYNYFIKVFKKNVNSTPGQFRRSK